MGLFSPHTNVLDHEFKKKGEAEPHNDDVFLSLFQRENMVEHE